MKGSICIKCENARADKCRWIARCIAVDGWEAEQVDYEGYTKIKTYSVHKCPNFLPEDKERRREAFKKLKENTYAGKRFSYAGKMGYAGNRRIG